MTIQTVPLTLHDLRQHREEILAITAQHGVTNVRLFGSIVREQARMDSDIDLLVDLPDGFTLLQLSGLVRSLKGYLGASIDVASAAHLRDELRHEILRDAQPL